MPLSSDTNRQRLKSKSRIMDVKMADSCFGASKAPSSVQWLKILKANTSIHERWAFSIFNNCSDDKALEALKQLSAFLKL